MVPFIARSGIRKRTSRSPYVIFVRLNKAIYLSFFWSPRFRHEGRPSAGSSKALLSTRIIKFKSLGSYALLGQYILKFQSLILGLICASSDMLRELRGI